MHHTNTKRFFHVTTRRSFLLLALLLMPLAGTSALEKDVRYDPTPQPVVRAMLKLAKVGPGDVIYDLGSGDGRIVITAAKEFGARGVGVDIDPELVQLAKANALKEGVADKVQFLEGDMYQADVRSATVVSLFLHPEPNLKLRPKLLSQLKPGSRIVSYIWDMGDWKPEAAIPSGVGDRKIYLWRIPERTPNAVKGK